MKGVTLDQLRTFCDVAALGSFSAAAERAGLTQPAVSLQIRMLERRLGVRLIERLGRRAQPTPAGRDLLLHAGRIGDEFAEALAALAPHRAGTVGRVRIGTGATACIYLLPSLLRALRRRLPGLEITVETGNTDVILDRLAANALDVALATLPISGRSFHLGPVYEDELVAVAPPGTALPPRVGAALLADKPLVLYEAGGSTRRVIDRWFARAGRTPKPVMELGSVEAIKELVGAGLGWAVLPRLAVSAAEGRGRVVVRPLSPRLSRTLAVVLRRDKRLDRGLRAVVDALSGLASDGVSAPARRPRGAAPRTGG
ncbi:LysR family transcriptional regulator [Rhodoplanes sp. TEM]|uniref:LysR family transcriptional regulator n=1 Tax=Rhodoplanes tepidamans TaxID=200616 RepID=A0ABT5J6N2_RHOTP|nr:MULTISPECIES: LysR family transcriptional regulator [Rhodoplanes]MDC7785178.1 LysR family transcriptional regulator [Rhodoplanes tepidamans]MDC7987128.1 LysR family transcriptional regulator [Rhodoplanes sp. TEM]MDQ0353435.1 DNA-binding transcriptional LysR family regulator [Rhodoplanes tepidamans]